MEECEGSQPPSHHPYIFFGVDFKRAGGRFFCNFSVTQDTPRGGIAYVSHYIQIKI